MKYGKSPNNNITPAFNAKTEANKSRDESQSPNRDFNITPDLELVDPEQNDKQGTAVFGNELQPFAEEFPNTIAESGIV